MFTIAGSYDFEQVFNTEQQALEFMNAFIESNNIGEDEGDWWVNEVIDSNSAICYNTLIHSKKQFAKYAAYREY